jgi:hypothetical protein
LSFLIRVNSSGPVDFPIRFFASSFDALGISFLGRIESFKKLLPIISSFLYPVIFSAAMFPSINVPFRSLI